MELTNKSKPTLVEIRRRLTFDLSGVPKARPLEGRVRFHAHEAATLDGEAYMVHETKDRCG